MKQLRISILMLLVFTLLTGIIYPVVITGIGRVLFKTKTDGSLLLKNGIVQGSALIGQKFEKREFFLGRPSAVNYDAGGSGGSNLGPANKKLIDGIKSRADHVRKNFNVMEKTAIPSDFLFASGSGLDPHISVEAAMIQAGRIAEIRKVDRKQIEDLIDEKSERQLYFYGNRFVNVLILNKTLADKGILK